MIKKFVFVLMPFDKEFDDIYKLGIKGACDETGAYCERVDEQIFSERILDRIYNQIHKADIIVADMSNKNPNVFYEVGYSHALNKNVILLTQNAEDIPFDFKHFPHIVYEKKIVQLKDQLIKRLDYFINQKQVIVNSSIESLELFISGMIIKDKLKIVLKEQPPELFSNTPPTFSFSISYHNIGTSPYNENSFLSIKIPRDLSASANEINIVDIPGDYVIYKFDKIPIIYPGSWEKQDYKIKAKKLDKTYSGTREYQSEIMINTPYGVYTYNVILEFEFNVEKRIAELSF